MAFKMARESDTGVVFEEAYAKIEGISGTKDMISFGLAYYANAQAAADKMAAIGFEQYYFVPSVADDAPNYHKQGYAHIKTIPAFADAVDVLEEGQTA